MNLLMCAPLCDSRGVIRYFVGAQIDVSGLVKECTELESLRRLVETQERGEEPPPIHGPSPEKTDELRELSEMLNQTELSTISRYGGRMHRETEHDDADSLATAFNQPRVLIRDPDILLRAGYGTSASGKLIGCFQHVRSLSPNFEMGEFADGNSTFLSDLIRLSESYSPHHLNGSRESCSLLSSKRSGARTVSRTNSEPQWPKAAA